MIFAVPYKVINAVISTISDVATPVTDRTLFMSGLKAANIWLAALNALAIIPSLLGFARKRQPST